MWKKILGFGFLLLVVVAGCGFAYLFLRKPAMAPPSTIKVEITEARLARGRYIFHHLSSCADCHSERDYSRFDGPIVEGGLGKGSIFPPELRFPGTVVAPNITPDKETGIGNWTDGEKIRAIREGIDRDGHALFPLMPYSSFRKMSDEDVFSVVAYLNALPPVKSYLPKTKINFPVSLFIKSAPRPAGSVPPPDRNNRLQYGEYLTTLGGCEECHTPAENGQVVLAKRFSGGREFRTSRGTVYSANITPDPDTGIGKWKEQHFLDKFYQYKRYVENGSPSVGPEGFTVMPWLWLCELQAEDLGAIYSYLESQTPIYNAVETHPLDKQPAALASGKEQGPLPGEQIADISTSSP